VECWQIQNDALAFSDHGHDSLASLSSGIRYLIAGCSRKGIFCPLARIKSAFSGPQTGVERIGFVTGVLGTTRFLAQILEVGLHGAW